jgi:hypothetical protein
MFGGEVAGKTAVVLLGAHRLHSLAGFLSEGVVPAGLAGDRPKKSAVFPGKPSHAGEKKIKASFLSFKKG